MPETPADRAKRVLIGFEIPRDGLALEIAQRCLQMTAPPGCDPGEQLDKMTHEVAPGVTMGETFRQAADAAVAYFHQAVSGARQAS